MDTVGIWRVFFFFFFFAVCIGNPAHPQLHLFLSTWPKLWQPEFTRSVSHSFSAKSFLLPGMTFKADNRLSYSIRGAVDPGVRSQQDALDPAARHASDPDRGTYSAGWAHGCRSLCRRDESGGGSRCQPCSRACRSCVPTWSPPPVVAQRRAGLLLRLRLRRRWGVRRSEGREEHSFFQEGDRV